MNTNEISVLINMVQAGGSRARLAMNDLLTEIQEEYADRALSKYIRKITVSGFDRDDLHQMFLIGCVEGIEQADPTIGSPIMFILKKGRWKVTDYMRSMYRKTIRQYCSYCQTETRIYQRGGESVCPSCGAVGDRYITRIQHTTSDDGTALAFIEDEQMDMVDKLTSEDIVETFRSRLMGRRLDVFNLIIGEGYDRESCGNYIAEVAEVLDISKANVNLRLRAIKTEWAEYIEEMSNIDI